MPRSSLEPLKVETVTPPAREPLGLPTVKQHLRIEDEAVEDDALTAGLLRAAVEQCEKHTGRALISRTLRYWLDRWPGSGDPVYWEGWREGSQDMLTRGDASWVEIPRPPLITVASVTTYDDSDVGTVMDPAGYFVDTASAPGRLVKRKGTTWPTAERVANAIEIQYEAGYGVDPSNVPEGLRNGILTLAAWLYEHRGEELDTAKAMASSGAEVMWAPFMLRRV